MKKKLFAALAILLLISCLTACNSSKSIDLAGFQKDIMDSDAFTDVISDIDDKYVALMRYDIKSDDVVKFTVGVSSFATPEEYAIFEAKDEQAAKRIFDCISNLIEMQKEAYGSYGPDQVPKLEKAIIKIDGVYVIYICADNYSTAKSVLDNNTK